VMNMIGAPKHVEKALEAGVDIICAQGGEGGGHTGDVATSILIPAVVDLCKGRKSPLNGQPVYVVAAGGIYDGRGLAMALCLGADAVWVGTRFVASTEAGAPKRHKEGVVKTGHHDTIRTIIYTGRPLRVMKTDYIMDWENNKKDQIKALTSKGILPALQDLEQREKKGEATPVEFSPLLMGAVAGSIQDVQSAAEIIDEMVSTAVAIFNNKQKLISKL